MAEFLSDPEGQKTKDHVPDVHCDTGPVPESVLYLTKRCKMQCIKNNPLPADTQPCGYTLLSQTDTAAGNMVWRIPHGLPEASRLLSLP